MHLQFQTNELTPPPYSYAVELKTEATKTGLRVRFELTYLFREHLDIEDILAEGFTENDDFTWEGTLNEEWKAHLAILEKENVFSGKTEIDESEDFWQIQIADQTGYPKDTETWLSFVNEIQQAILEKDEREAPLQITVLRNREKIYFRASFAQRQFTVEKNGSLSRKKWEDLNPFLNDLFGGEFRPDQAKQKEPQKAGLYVETGDGLWYELGKSLLMQPSKIQQWL
ncbi:hypothetical protein LAG90_04725 [Marinilongibacter aquaticus]|uniref:hypothetical protein n=1 Tax=Marinilongibacter aquaticus TaxID=2975157 RepID=UPI0021BD6FB9|nr:hypothetical protein [Marinilongibacter aquaticus]UBM59952.1 hypothetical protein LAG90_04725 [Marinilongibacter aquaticus]